jgi:hypothetical protein
MSSTGANTTRVPTYAASPKGVPDDVDVVAKEGSLVVTGGEPVENWEQQSVQRIKTEN